MRQLSQFIHLNFAGEVIVGEDKAVHTTEVEHAGGEFSDEAVLRR